jgi:peptidoglycan biosynthesis protein MviN/MurJ (putative lipid II flippase)
VGRLRPHLSPVRKDLPTAAAAIIGSLPGFTLPFVAALVLPPDTSDLLLLAMSVAITVSVIVSSAVELTTIAEYGRVLGRDRNPAPDALRDYRRRVLLFATALTALVVPALAVAYAIGSPARAEFVVLVCAVAPAPILAAIASILSGECIARGGPTVPIAVQAMRTLLPAVLLAVWWDAPLVVVAAMLPAGEAARAVVLAVAARRLRAQQAGAEDGALTPFGLVAQALSSGVTQLGPAVDRLFLSASGAGSVSSYEIADRLMYAAAQFVNMAFLVRRVGAWARLPTMAPGDATALLRRDGRVLGIVTAVLTAGGALACLAGLASGLLPESWNQGFLWGAIVMLSLPAHVFNVVGTRLLVVARRQRWMLGIAAATAVLNAVLDTIFYVLLGPVGIVVATLLLRWTMAGVYLVLLRTAVPQTIGQERSAGPGR